MKGSEIFMRLSRCGSGTRQSGVKRQRTAALQNLADRVAYGIARQRFGVRLSSAAFFNTIYDAQNIQLHLSLICSFVFVLTFVRFAIFADFFPPGYVCVRFTWLRT